ncbi:Fc.00g080030.m01.CDS01 [Cosmosporella sp. VM-42]
MAQPRMPSYITVNGIDRLAMNIPNPERHRPDQPQNIPLEENFWEFITIAAAVNVGIEILETRKGRQALQKLGERLVSEWQTDRRHTFGGDVRYMSSYVNHFLEALRKDFPNIFIADLGGPNVLATTRRMPGGLWNGDLNRLKPKQCVGIYFNSGRVADMVAVSSSNYRSGSKASKRYKHFQFMFGVATSHELCHAFVAYLSQNSQSLYGYTPPGISHLNYGVSTRGEDEVIEGGEAGRWFENRLFGGSLEFYRDLREDDGQLGIPHIIDGNDNAWKIDPTVILALVESPRRLEFPFGTVGSGLSPQERIRRRLRSLGSTDSEPRPQVGQRAMRTAMSGGRVLLYNVSREALRRVAITPGALQAVRVR